jgi:hypothetical protein
MVTAKQNDAGVLENGRSMCIHCMSDPNAAVEGAMSSGAEDGLLAHTYTLDMKISGVR